MGAVVLQTAPLEKMGLWSWFYDWLSDNFADPKARSYLVQSGLSQEQIDNAFNNIEPLNNYHAAMSLAPAFIADPAGTASLFGSIASGSVTSPFSSFFDPYAPQVATGSDSPFSGLTSPFSVQASVDDVNKAMNGTNESPAADTSFDWTKWFSQLGQTAEEAARLQAQRNEDAAYQAYLRSEVAADNALRRARELRQTQYPDIVASLTAAGLNPVLAATGGLAGSSTTAPMANAPSSSSSSAGGLNAANLLTAISSMLSAAGNLLKGLNPTQIVKNFFS